MDAGPFVTSVPDNGKPPLLLLHGFMMSRAIWDANLDALCELTRPVRIELFGHGRSLAPQIETAYRPENYFAFFEELRKELQVEKWLICAHSLGASLGLSYALAFPGAVGAIVFSNTRSALGMPEDFKPENRPVHLREKVLGGGVEGLRGLPSHAINMKHVDPSVRQKLLEDSKLLRPEGIVNTIFQTTPYVNVRKRIDQIPCPALLINGRFERRFQPLRNWIDGRAGNLSIVDVDAGHSPNAEEPTVFNEIALEFLRKKAL